MTEVIKVVREGDGRLVSVFAVDEWELEYAIDKTTKPKKGFIFAYAADDLSLAKVEYTPKLGQKYFKAEATIVGSVAFKQLKEFDWWDRWWEKFNVEESKGDYLLCSELTLLSEIK